MEEREPDLLEPIPLHNCRHSIRPCAASGTEVEPSRHSRLGALAIGVGGPKIIVTWSTRSPNWSSSPVPALATPALETEEPSDR